MKTRVMATLAVTLLGGWAALTLPGCEAGKCSQGEACSKSCPEGQAGLCVARGICECVVGGGGAGGGVGDGGVDVNCRPVALGELRINEVMTDGEGRDEDTEFVELVNLSGEAVNLDGVKLLEVGDERAKITFGASCLPAQGVVAVFRSPEFTVTEPPAGIVYDLGGASFGFPNSADYQLVLQGPDGALYDQFAVPTALVASSVSVNRSPDFTGVEVVRHDTLVIEGSSPGRCANGGTYASGCIPGMGGDGGTDGGLPPVCDPPAPGALVLNEVLVDGQEGGSSETDEFVEIVNTGAAAADLTGLTIAKNGEEPDVSFESGCLPGGGAVAVRKGAADAWIFAPTPAVLPVGNSSLRLTNSADNTLVLADATGAALSTITVPEALVEQGISANRDPDLSGDMTARHDELFGVPQSPALCPDGVNSYADGCQPVVRDDMGPPADGGMDMGPPPPDMGPPPCEPPQPGDLVLNELLVNGNEGGSQETDEFVELVNTAARPVAMDGVMIGAQRDDGAPVTYATFRGGCIPPEGAVAVRRTEGASDWFPVPDVPPTIEPEGVRLVNGATWTFRLLAGAQILSELTVAENLVEDGVSACRVPDLTGDAIQRHDEAYPGTASSPAACPDGSRYSAGCQ